MEDSLMAWRTPDRWKEGIAAAMQMEESKAERKAERILRAERKADLPPMNKERKQSPGFKRAEKEAKKREKEKQKA